MLLRRLYGVAANESSLGRLRWLTSVELANERDLAHHLRCSGRWSCRTKLQRHSLQLTCVYIQRFYDRKQTRYRFKTFFIIFCLWFLLCTFLLGCVSVRLC